MNNYHVLIIGTGVTESIIAAALARHGKKVLHVDRNPYYGGKEPNFNIRQLFSWIIKEKVNVTVGPLKAIEGWRVDNVEKLPNDVEEEIESLLVHAQLPKQHASLQELANLCRTLIQCRQFNVDLYPKLLFSRGAFVNLLVESSVGKYLEFKALSNLTIDTPEMSIAVPCTKEDVFTSDTLGLADKRRLMKALKMAQTEHDDAPNPFSAYLETLGLTTSLQDIVANGVATCTDPTNGKLLETETALHRVDLFTHSVERYSKIPLLIPMYGSCSEFSQAFCRYAAVYGATYVLGQGVENLVGNEFEALDGEKCRADYIVVGEGEIVEQGLGREQEGETLACSLLILQTSLEPGLLVSCVGEKVLILQVNHETMTCPRDYSLVWFVKRSRADARATLQPIVERHLKVLGAEEAVKLSLFYTRSLPNVIADDHIIVAKMDGMRLDVESNVQYAKSVVQEILGNDFTEPWLKAPEEVETEVNEQ